jgi:hypothetical protein
MDDALRDPVRRRAALPPDERMTSVEAALAGLRAAGYSHVRATEIVIERAEAAALDADVVVLVEGWSDQIVLERLGRRRGHCELREDGICIVPMGGATNIGRLIDKFGPRGRNARLAGLYDAAEERHVVRSLEDAGFGRRLDRETLQSLGFFICVIDLEDELIRALGPARVERVIDAAGDLASFRRMQYEPYHRRRALERQLHRFVASRKYRYMRALADALDLAQVPPPLAGVLDHVSSAPPSGEAS